MNVMAGTSGHSLLSQIFDDRFAAGASYVSGSGNVFRRQLRMCVYCADRPRDMP